MKQEHIDKIVDLFKEAKVWNSGKFMDLVATYCREQNLDFIEISKKLEIAFRDVLATNITSENAIRFRLKSAIPKNVAL
jgi:hypothetical protein